MSRRNSLVPVTFTNLKGKAIALKVGVEFGNADHIAYLARRQQQIAGTAQLDKIYVNNKPSFFQCVNPAQFNPDEYDHPACMSTHFADWHEIIECRCGFLYKYKNGGMYRIFEKPTPTSWELDADFAVVCEAFQIGAKETWGESISKEEAHENLKKECNYKEFLNEETGEIFKVSKTTANLTTLAFEDYLERCRQFIYTWFGITVPMPNEQAAMSFENGVG